MTRLLPLAASLALFISAGTAAGQNAPKPKRINKAIDLLSQGQPIWYHGGEGGVHGDFDQGKELAQTWADFIVYDFENRQFDVARLADFMRGLVAGGPTRSGHRTPTVIVTLPTDGTNEAVMRANAWMIKQVLNTGVQGVELCHAQDPGAVKAFVEAVRFPYMRLGVNEGLDEGYRGAHGSAMAAPIWGLTPLEYAQKADVWPLNPNGELLLGIKIEDKRGLAKVDQILSVPGIGFVEGGGKDMAYSLGFPENRDNPRPPELQAAETRRSQPRKGTRFSSWMGCSPTT